MEMAARQVDRSLVRPVTIAAALTGTIQALTWVGLSIVAILFYHSVILIDDTLPFNSFRNVIYQLFLKYDYTNEEVIVTPKNFSIFMYIYVAISFVWLITSLYMLWAMTRNKWSNGYTIIGLWSAITLAISVLDVVLISLTAADFVTVQDLINPAVPIPTTEPTFTTPETTIGTIPTTLPTSLETTISSTTSWTTTISTEAPNNPENDPGLYIQNSSRSINYFQDVLQNLINGDASFQAFIEFDSLRNVIYTIYVTVISLAARGYILWIVNVIFAIILIGFARGLKRDATPSLLPIAGAYATGGRPPWNNLYEQTDIGNGYSNDGFRDENDRGMFPRSDSFVTDHNIKNRNPLSNGGNPYVEELDRRQQNLPPNHNVANGRVAKIGKSGGRRTPPQNVPPPNVPMNPYIPDPDYSPPVSPMPKSVLRPRSNYIL